MSSSGRKIVAGLGSAALVVCVAGTSSAASGTTTNPTPGVKTVAKGLDGPYGLSFVTDSRILVTEGDSGEVTRINPVTGAKATLIKGAGGAAAVAEWNGAVYVALGGPNEEGAPPAGKYPPSSILKANADGSGVRVFADLLAYEMKHNPDGQVQLVKGKPVDALSNPFAMNASKYGLLVADGGANDVLRINRDTGAISTFFVPPTVKTKFCLDPKAQANPGTIGCDPVPTGIAVARGNVYVSTLGAFSPGGARIYQIDPQTRKVEHVWKGFTALTGIAVAPSGTIYVSEVMFGAPEGEGPPPAGFDPSTVGRITRITPNGTVTHAQVTMPTGLAFHDGHLYATTWVLAGAFGTQHAGQVAKVGLSAFK